VKTVDENLDSKTKAWVFLMQLGAKMGCHQLHERSFFFRGYQFPVCARCTGLFIGYTAGILCFGFMLKFELIKLFIVAFIAVLALGIDGILQLKKICISNNGRRLITGLLCGFFLMSLLLKIIFEVFAKFSGI
jgi:uncharacterized membrane protein